LKLASGGHDLFGSPASGRGALQVRDRTKEIGDAYDEGAADRCVSPKEAMGMGYSSQPTMVVSPMRATIFAT